MGNTLHGFPASFFLQGLLGCFRAFIIPCGGFDFPEDLSGKAADRRSQRVCRLPGIEIKDVQEILMFKIAVWVIRTPAVETVSDAGRRSPPECHPGFKLMITGQVAFLNDVEDLPAVVVPVIRREPFRCRVDHGFQGLPFPGNIKGLFQSFHDRLPVFLFHLP
ncbi:MAG: hypothetical protein IJI08_10210 [Clostridia bacterium]|nr:hypothetical protein [Clostridia bacterium]